MELLDNAEPMLKQYKGLLCDIWGVVHNGVDVFPSAVDALEAYRRSGGSVALITNAPRPSLSVQAQLAQIGVPETAWDIIVTSGDAIRALLTRHPGSKFFHLGPDRDHALIEGLDLELVNLARAEYVLCTGLYDDETETPQDYVSLLGKMVDKQITMYCANPDKVVHRGERLIYCAGAIADRYREMGGRVILAGKPHEPIYRLVFEQLEQTTGSRLTSSQVLAIGDSIATDLSGAAAAGLDTLFISGGIHGHEVGTALDRPEEAILSGFLENLFRELPSLRLVGVQPRLAW